jgi:hypothetical protein
LDDVMIRRTSWRQYHHNHLELAGNVARWMAAELAWSDSDVAQELQQYRQLTGAAEIPAPHILAPHANGNGRSSAAPLAIPSNPMASK